MKLQNGFGGLSVYWFNNGGCQLCAKAFSDYLSKSPDIGYKGIRVTKNVLHANCMIINGANCLTQEENVQKEFSRSLENASIILFGDCGMQENNIFQNMKNAFYISDTQEFIPITHRITGCPPTFEKIESVVNVMLNAENKKQYKQKARVEEIETISEPIIEKLETQQ